MLDLVVKIIYIIPPLNSLAAHISPLIQGNKGLRTEVLHIFSFLNSN